MGERGPGSGRSADGGICREVEWGVKDGGVLGVGVCGWVGEGEGGREVGG